MTPTVGAKRRSAADMRHFEIMSCAAKHRYSIEPLCTLNQYAYPCNICGGWHKATKRDDE